MAVVLQPILQSVCLWRVEESWGRSCVPRTSRVWRHYRETSDGEREWRVCTEEGVVPLWELVMAGEEEESVREEVLGVRTCLK